MVSFLSQMTFIQLPAVLIGLAVLFLAFNIVYKLYFHHLSKFPGPTAAAISDIWWARHWIAGKWPYDLERLHEKYGSVVRIAPNEISFATPQSFQDIYGHVNKAHKPFLKTREFYCLSGSRGVPDIVSVLDPKQHSAMRKTLSPAFSSKALRDQTTVVLKYVNLWIDQLKILGTGEDGIDIAKWYNWLTFDIIGDLAFGESFDAVKNGIVAGNILPALTSTKFIHLARTHEWVSIIFNSISLGPYVMAAKRIPVLWPVLPFLVPKGFITQQKKFVELTRQKVLSRMKKDNSRNDFFSHMLSEKSNDSSEKLMIAQGGVLIIAGSETTQTFLTAVTFFLLKYPETLRRLCDEIRGAFSDPDAIDDAETKRLPYLFAVIEEGLRLFPPVSEGMPRYSPGAMVDGFYVPEGVTVSTSAHTMGRSSQHFCSSKSFCPERWLPESHTFYDPRFANDQKDAFRPFSLGPRSCLGINLAYIEMRIILAKVLWHFDWELMSQGVDWERDTELQLLWSKPVFRVKFLPVRREET